MERLIGPYEGNPWDQQRGEPDSQFARFNHYLEQSPGGRTFTRVAQQYDLSPGTVSETAYRYRWKERAAAYDAHRTQERRETIAHREIDLAEQQMDLATEATMVLQRSVRAVLDADIALEPRDMLPWARMIEIFRRIALDHPDQVVELTGADGGPVQVSEFEGLSQDQARDRAVEMASSVLRVINGGRAS